MCGGERGKETLGQEEDGEGRGGEGKEEAHAVFDSKMLFER